uniref:Methylenetetrahydrofolate reductase (NAD(P)H) n=1 Tax=Ditylenchus dipsaci TaxID=166011 RepID=A0A915DME6_9BILA
MVNSLAEANPLFISITWRANKASSNISSARAVRDVCRQEVLLNMSCTGIPKWQTLVYLRLARQAALYNIFALRGDMAQTHDPPFNFNALDMVDWVRQEYSKADCVTIGIAGYPESHPLSANQTADLMHLKPTSIHQFCERCRAAGIHQPIIPGILLFRSFEMVKRLSRTANVHIPANILHTLDLIQDDQQTINNYSLYLAVTLCRRLLTELDPCIHIFTLNQPQLSGILLRTLGFWIKLDVAIESRILCLAKSFRDC